MPNGRQTCACGAAVLEVRVDATRYVVDWPAALAGDIAVMQTVAGGFQAEYAPVGEDSPPALPALPQRTCAANRSKTSASRLHEPVPFTDAWKAANREKAKQRVRQKGRRPAAAVRYRIPPQ